ncbi:Serine protease inhibitor [Abeliophyllum distichum]|uniref:Serine protease inhibitor n=1 Tax=Abeliophyllum distichum TaxID=126358 RepID=A0ABD1TDH2_9LAMI
MEEACPNAGKSTWPELLGVQGQVAVGVIARENKKVSVGTVKEGMMVTADFRCDRVRVWLDNREGDMADCPGKDSWPELLGAKGEAAAAVIEKENRHVDAIVLKEGTPVTKDFRCDRVRVWVNDNGIVIRIPRVG